MFALAFFALVVCSFTSCASSGGRSFADVASADGLTPKGGKAKIVLYHSRGGEFLVWANNDLIAKGLKRFSFVTYDATPGKVRIYCRSGSGNSGIDFVTGGLTGVLLQQKRERLALDVQSGQTYYIELHCGMWGENVDLRTKAEADEVLGDYHLLPPAQ